MPRTPHLSRGVAALALLALAGVVAGILLASGTPGADKADTSGVRSLDGWFSVLRDGERPDAAALEAVRDAAAIDPSQAPAETARIAARTPDGRPIVVSGADGIVCMIAPGYGGGCSGGELVREPPVIVQGVGHDGPVGTTHFRALAGDGVEQISVTTAAGEIVDLAVHHNVAFASIRGRVASWSWVTPEGEQRSERVED
jgi:hypothetical protein